MRWLGPVGWCLVPVSLGAAIVVWGLNPWFLDAPLSFFLLVGLVPGLIGLVWGSVFRRSRRPWGLLLSLGLGTFAVVRPLPGPVGTGLLIVGIDGATWSVADGLDLPHLQGLRSAGQSGVLLGEPPLFSPLLWTTMATGKRPADHGIRGFRVAADHALAARFWEIAQSEGKSVGLYKWLVTHPPPEAGAGFVVPAWLAADARTHPKHLGWVKELELSRRLKRKKVATTRSTWRLVLAGIPDGLRWSTIRAGIAFQFFGQDRLPEKKRGALLHRLRILIDRDVFIAQLHRHRPDVATLTLYATDALGHSHWGINQNHVVKQAYLLSDQVLGEAVAAAGPQTTVLVLSDHGFRAAAPDDRARRRRATTEGLRALLQAEVGSVDVARVGHKLTVSTLAEDQAAGVAALRAWLQAFRVEKTGLPLYRMEPVPDQPYALGLTLRADAFDPAALESLTVRTHPLADFVRLAPGQAGEHDAAGIAVLTGPGIEPGSLGEVSQLDVTPTILALLGLPAAHDMPGRSWVAEAGPRVESYDALAPAQSPASQPAEIDEEQLRALGYVE